MSCNPYLSRVFSFKQSEALGIPEDFPINYPTWLPNGVSLDVIKKIWTIDASQLSVEDFRAKEISVFLDDGKQCRSFGVEFKLNFQKPWEQSIVGRRAEVVDAALEYQTVLSPFNSQQAVKKRFVQQYEQLYNHYGKLFNRVQWFAQGVFLNMNADELHRVIALSNPKILVSPYEFEKAIENFDSVEEMESHFNKSKRKIISLAGCNLNAVFLACIVYSGNR